jgi:phosphoserine phosphatase RsbU/P
VLPFALVTSRRKLLILILLSLTAIARAQVTIDRFPPGLVEITEGWRYQSGDDLNWANPAFDDRAWQHIAPQPQSDCFRSCWYRLRIQLPPHHPPLAMFLAVREGAVEAYINGRRFDQLRFMPGWLVSEPHEFALPIPDDSDSILFAFRIHPERFGFDSGEAPIVHTAMGSPESAQIQAAAHRSHRLIRFLPSFGVNLAIFLGGISALLLFASHRRPEYLWLGLYLVLLSTAAIALTGSSYGWFPGDANEFYGDPAIYICVAVQIEFTFAFIRRRPGRIWRAYEVFLLLCPIASLFCSAHLIRNYIYLAFEASTTLPGAVGLPILLLYWHRHGNREARWLILPSLAPAAGVILTNFFEVCDFLGWHVNIPRQIMLWGEAPLYFYDIADAVFMVAIGFVMFFRFSWLSREQARTTAELDAAREIQRQLVPATLPTLRNCHLEAAYLPATEVGGDFYQILPQRDDSSLIVIGDVSGKGLKAAMTGTLAIGALRTLAQENLSPTVLLARLNRQLAATQDGGFITCLCARLAPGGTLTVANAGHLSPYLNGKEVTLDCGLPLGITADAEYTEATINLAPGDRIALMTDGVVEATSPSGELFGFARTSAISAQSAQQVAAAAQSFGQNDDITVLTITFTATQAINTIHPSVNDPSYHGLP